MRKLIILIALYYLASIETNGQLWKLRRYEVTAGIGTTQLYGDIGGYTKGKNVLGLRDFTIRQTRLNINASLKYRIISNFSARLNIIGGSFHATDTRGSNEIRGFESSTRFLEPSILGEYYIKRYNGEKSFIFMKGIGKNKSSFFSKLEYYVFGGIGGLSYHLTPNDKLSSKVKKISGFTPVIPAGIGVNLIYSNYYNFGIELGGRYSFSDNVDGYTSSYSASNDVYYFLNFTFTYKIKTGSNGLPLFR